MGSRFAKSRASKAGFSLVELSIVLVILGLLVGGILTGQNLIHAAELRSVTTQIHQYETAINIFKDKYFALPGDMTNATLFWGKDNTNCPTHSGTADPNGTCNGNGEGRIICSHEGARFWQHLALAGLIDGTYQSMFNSSSPVTEIGVSVPNMKFQSLGITMANTENGNFNDSGVNDWGPHNNGNMFFIGSQGDITRGPGLTPEEMWNLDTKMDDGRPGLGIFAANKAYTSCHSTLLAETAQYQLSNDSKVCSIRYLVK